MIGIVISDRNSVKLRCDESCDQSTSVLSNLFPVCSGEQEVLPHGARYIWTRPIGVVEIHLRAKLHPHLCFSTAGLRSIRVGDHSLMTVWSTSSRHVSSAVTTRLLAVIYDVTTLG